MNRPQTRTSVTAKAMAVLASDLSRGSLTLHWPPTMTNNKPSTTWSGVQRVQRDDTLVPTVALPPLMTLLDVYDLIPAEIRRKVSLKWLRKNLPNRRKLGGSAVWSSADVMEFLQNGLPLAAAPRKEAPSE